MSAKYQTGDQFYEDFGSLKDRIVEIKEVLANGMYRVDFARIPGAIVPACVLRPYTRRQLDVLRRVTRPGEQP